MEQINVLDCGYVRLIDHMGSDLSVVRAARVSYNAEWRTGEDHGSDKRLIDYLWKNKHTTPFEAVEFQFEVFCPIFVARQWVKHRTTSIIEWTINEVSGRYTVLPEQFYIPNIEDIGTQSKNNKQTREYNPFNEEVKKLREAEIARITELCLNSFEEYYKLVDSGWPRELARIVLPLNTYTHFFAKTDLLNLLKFCNLRNHEHAQYEIRVYAEAIEKIITPYVPVTMEVYRKYLTTKPI